LCFAYAYSVILDEKKSEEKENLASDAACFVLSVDYAGGSFYGRLTTSPV
jgi:hypothetical protein